MPKKDLGLWFAAALSGLLMALSSAPFDQWYLAYIAYVPLFVATHNVSAKKQGLAFALACTIIAANWWHSTIIFSAIFFILILIALAFSFYLWAILSAPFRTKSSHPLLHLFMPAVIWVGIERILSSELVGIPCNIGITQSGQPLLIQSASLFGIYTTSFLIIIANTAFSMLALQAINNNWSSKINNKVIGLAFIIMFVNVGYGFNSLSKSVAPENPINVVMIQPVIASNLYGNTWRDPKVRSFVKNTLDELTKKSLKLKPDLIVWPEGGNGLFNMRIETLRNQLYQLAKNNNTNLLISSNDLTEDGLKYNSVFSISNSGKLLDRYDKVMLLPGSEDSFTAGKQFKTTKTNYGKIGLVICYESNFPSPLRKITSQGGGLLVASTSDAPFKRTSLTINHTRTAIFRAIENNRWIVHASNTGPSVIASPQGIITASIGFYERGFTSGVVGYIKEQSIFTRFGYLVPILFSLVVLIIILRNIYIFLRQNGFNPLNIDFNISLLQMLKNKLHIIIRYFPIGTIHLLLVVALVFSSIGIVYRMTPVEYTDDITDSIPVTHGSHQALKEFFEPLTVQIQDKVGINLVQADRHYRSFAALAYLLSYYGNDALASELVSGSRINRKDLSKHELKIIAANNGFDAKNEEVDNAALVKLLFPVIATINNNNFVVINNISAGVVFLFDPASGNIEINQKQFESIWDGYIFSINTRAIKETI